MKNGHKVKPYPDREAIDFNQALEGKAEVLGYVPDPVEVFFLHIQGSGQLAVRRRLPPAGWATRPATASPTAPSARMMLKEEAHGTG